VSELPISTIVGGAAFVAGLIFGATAQRTNFCTMGALSDIVFMGDWRRFRAWMLALSVAMIGSQALHHFGMVDLGKSIYLSGPLAWAGAIIGGLLFGFGMTLAGGCGNKTLVRIGGGNLKSLVTFLMVGLFAYMTLKGLIGLGRVQIEALTNITVTGKAANQGIPALLTALGLSEALARWLVVAVVAGGLLVFCFKDEEFRAAPHDIWGGLIIGLMVPAGWWITGVMGADDFDPYTVVQLHLRRPHRRFHDVSDDLYRLDHQFRYRRRRRRHIRVVPVLGDSEKVQPGSLFRHRRHGTPSDRRRHDGHWRRHGHGLHHRPGPDRHLDPVGHFVLCPVRHPVRRNLGIEIHGGRQCRRRPEGGVFARIKPVAGWTCGREGAKAAP